MKLKELKNHFNFNHLTKEEKAKLQQQKEEANFEFLRKHLSVIFPLAGKLEKGDLHIIQEVNDFLVANAKCDYDHSRNKLEEENMLYNIDNDNWVAKYFKKMVDKHVYDLISEDNVLNEEMNKTTEIAKEKYIPSENGKDLDFDSVKKPVVLRDLHKFTKIPLNTYKKFVETDADFNKAREQYQFDITRAQIVYSNGLNTPNEVLRHHDYSDRTQLYSVKTFYDPCVTTLEKDCHNKYFNGLVDGLTHTGLNHYTVEKAMVKYAPMWLQQRIKDAVKNKYVVEPEAMEAMHYRDWYMQAYNAKLFEDEERILTHDFYEDHKDVCLDMGYQNPIPEKDYYAALLKRNNLESCFNKMVDDYQAGLKIKDGLQRKQNDDKQI